MGTTITASGTQTAVISTEHTLQNPASAKHYAASIDLTNMASGDTTEIRVYLLIKSAGSYILYNMSSYSGAQTNPLLFVPFLPSSLGYKLTLKQTAGTGRNYDWVVFEQ